MHVRLYHRLFGDVRPVPPKKKKNQTNSCSPWQQAKRESLKPNKRGKLKSPDTEANSDLVNLLRSQKTPPQKDDARFRRWPLWIPQNSSRLRYELARHVAFVSFSMNSSPVQACTWALLGPHALLLHRLSDLSVPTVRISRVPAFLHGTGAN